MLHLELIWMESHQVRYLLILQVKFLVGDPSKIHGGHLRSPTFVNNWEPNKLGRGIAVIAFVSARRIEWCIIWHTWVTGWPCPDLIWGQILTLTFQGQTIHGSTRPDETNTMVSNRCSTFKIKDCIVQKPFWKIWNFDPWRPQFWPEPKMTEMISKWFFASFRTPFSVLFYNAQEPR